MLDESRVHAVGLDFNGFRGFGNSLRVALDRVIFLIRRDHGLFRFDYACLGGRRRKCGVNVMVFCVRQMCGGWFNIRRRSL